MMWIVEIKPYMPRKHRFAVCSLYRDKKTVVHTTVNGKGHVGRLVQK